MHLGLIDGPYVPHNLISAQESPVPLPKFQVAPRLKILMSSGSKKGTQIYYPFLTKSPGKRIPSRFPNGAPMERESHLQDVFISLLIYCFNISSRVPSKGVLPPGPPYAVPQRCPVPRALLHSSFKVPDIRATHPDSRFPSGIKGPIWREMPVSGAFFNLSSRVSSRGALCTEPLHREMLRT